jgi:hypothetical protein
MKNSTIKAWCCLVIILLVLQGCGIMFESDEQERMRQELEFKPYQQKNSIEGYREFIAKYPENMFIPIARGAIEDLEYAPCEQKDTIEGYREFIRNFPSNRNRSRADGRIEQLVFKRVEDTDTIAAYRDFLLKNPRSNYTLLAQQRLQDLEFEALDKICREQYGFDLLLYRLNAGRLQKELAATSAAGLADFTLFASIDTDGSRKCFRTYLIYGDAMARLDTGNKEAFTPFLNSIITKLLLYLDQKSAAQKALDGYCFTIASSAGRFHGDAAVLFSCYFTAESVHQFARGTLQPGELLAGATVSSPQKTGGARP